METPEIMIGTNQITATIDYKGVSLTIEFYAYEGEPEIRYFQDGSGQQGSPPEIEIQKITHKETDLTELLENDFDKIEQILWDKEW